MILGNTFTDYMVCIPSRAWPIRFQAERAYEDMSGRDSDVLRSACVDLHGCSGRFLREAFAAGSTWERYALSQAAGACAGLALQAQLLLQQREAAERAMESEAQGE